MSGSPPLQGLIASAGMDAVIKIWTFKGTRLSSPSECFQTLYGHTGPVTSLAAFDGGLVSGSNDCTVRLWRCVQQQEEESVGVEQPWRRRHFQHVVRVARCTAAGAACSAPTAAPASCA